MWRFKQVYKIWHHLLNLKNKKNTHEAVWLLVKLQVSTKSWLGTKSSKASYIIFKIH